MAEQKNIYVYMDAGETDCPILMGTLHSEMIRWKEVFSFENDPEWLKYSQFRALDPDLVNFSGKQYLPSGKNNFGMFLDSSPDRWGRVLMRRREALIARMENRPVRALTETDYLMGVYDGNRMGALRFKFVPDGDFMDHNKALATPPWASIRDLEYASLELEKEDVKEDASYSKWLTMLIAPGSSLGGARPKANILDENGRLWIAKFPSGHDTKNVGAWEAVTSELALDCGIQVSDFRAQKFSSKDHTFLTKRFDRSDDGKRIHFASAMHTSQLRRIGFCQFERMRHSFSTQIHPSRIGRIVYPEPGLLISFVQTDKFNVEQRIQMTFCTLGGPGIVSACGIEVVDADNFNGFIDSHIQGLRQITEGTERIRRMQMRVDVFQFHVLTH